MLHTRIVLLGRTAACDCAACGVPHYQELTATLLYLGDACMGALCPTCLAHPEEALPLLAGRSAQAAAEADAAGNAAAVENFDSLAAAARGLTASGVIGAWLTLTDYVMVIQAATGAARQAA